MKKIKLVLLGVVMLGTLLIGNTDVEASELTTLENVPMEVKSELINSGYDLNNVTISYVENIGPEVTIRARAIPAEVQSACFITKDSWGTAISGGWNIRYKTLNVRNGYQLTGFYEVYYKKSGNNHIYDRIFNYRTW